MRFPPARIGRILPSPAPVERGRGQPGVLLLKVFGRRIAKSATHAASARLIAAADALQALAAVVEAPEERKRSAPKPAARKAKPAEKRRAGLADTVAWIAAGGMPALPAAARRKPAVPRGASFAQARFSGDQGARSYKLYVPAVLRTAADASLRLPAPLVVMLHGCGQTPEDFAAGTGMNALAEEFGLIVA